MNYKLEVMGRATASFGYEPLLHEAEFDAIADLRDAVFTALFADSVHHVLITHNGKRRMVVNCAQFCADYMQDAPPVAG